MKEVKNGVVVSGGTRGIGLAIVKLFISKGHQVITCGRNRQTVEDLKRVINSDLLHVYQADLSSKAGCFSFYEHVCSVGLEIGVLINNTGQFVPGQIHNEPDGILENQIQTNLYSAYYLTRALVPEMIKKKSGHIFTICSIASIVAYPNGGSYSISKFALYGMNKVLREELKPFGIRVTSVLPGATYTDSWAGAGFPIKRFMKAEDIALSIYDVYSLSPQTVVEEIIIRPQLGDI